MQKQKLVQTEEPSSHQALGHVQVLVQGLPTKVSCLKGQMKLRGQLQGRVWRLKVQVLGQELGQLPEVIACLREQMMPLVLWQGHVLRLKVLVLGLVQELQP